MSRKAYTAPGSAAVGPYSHAVEAGGFVFLSGQTPIVSGTNRLAEGGVREQTGQCFENLRNVLTAAGLTMADVVKVNVYLADMKDFPEMNEAYKGQFEIPYPARSTVGVLGLPLGAKVEIEMVAKRP
ncbi:MAG TPA: Rid family detoxifying hydrolase [Magnetospirillaceae bacterium]|nr:Rid family detoxifying hydrolase [Magnetospirillaceae bacterium]